MRNRFTKFIFPLIVVLLLAPWPVAYAYSYDDALAAPGAVRIEVAEPSAAPSGNVFRRSVGSITPGDLFYIDATVGTDDIKVTLHLTNAEELYHSYRYLTLEVGVYVENYSGGWERASGYDGEPVPETFITLQNGYVSFILGGGARYKVTIDGGSLYCITGSASGGSLSPKFYLTVD